MEKLRGNHVPVFIIFHAVHSRDQKRVRKRTNQATNTKIAFLKDHIFVGIIFLEKRAAPQSLNTTRIYGLCYIAVTIFQVNQFDAPEAC